MPLDRFRQLRPIVLCLTLFVSAALADGGEAKAISDWATLSPPLRATLAPFAQRWDSLPATQRAVLRRNAERWNLLEPEERARRLERLQHWLALDPAQRARLRTNYAYWRALDRPRQVELQRLQSRLAANSIEDQQQARQRHAADPDRRAALLSAIGIDADAMELAQRSFAFVPEAEHTATLSAVQSLDAQARADLDRLIRRRAPWQRETLRQELLALPAEERSAWLRERTQSR